MHLRAFPEAMGCLLLEKLHTEQLLHVHSTVHDIVPEVNGRLTYSTRVWGCIRPAALITAPLLLQHWHAYGTERCMAQQPANCLSAHHSPMEGFGNPHTLHRLLG